MSVAVRLGEAAQLTVATAPDRERATATLRARNEQDVTVSLFDALGRRVRVLHRGRLEPRRPRRIRVETRGLASALYFLPATGERFRETRRVSISL